LAPVQTENVKLPAWAGGAVNRLAIPVCTLNPTVTNLPDGMRLLVQPETISDTVSVYGRIRNNPKIETPSGKEGVDEVLDRLLAYSTESLDRLAFQMALNDMGAVESPGTDLSLQVSHDSGRERLSIVEPNSVKFALRILARGAFYLIAHRKVGGDCRLAILEQPCLRRNAQSKRFPARGSLYGQRHVWSVEGHYLVVSEVDGPGESLKAATSQYHSRKDHTPCHGNAFCFHITPQTIYPHGVKGQIPCGNCGAVLCCRSEPGNTRNLHCLSYTASRQAFAEIFLGNPL
jgi:hypothetical protein